MVSDALRNGIGGTSDAAATPFLRWKQKHRGGGDSVPPLSARKLAASLWRLAITSPAGGTVTWQCVDRLGFQFRSSFPITKFASEGATKWDYLDWKAWDCGDAFRSNVKLNSGEGGGCRTKIKNRMRKMNEERAPSVRTEWCSVINNLTDGIKKERKICRNMDKMNSSLLRDIAAAKSSARKSIRNLEREKRAREELEGACYNLAEEIEGRKAEIGVLRDEHKRVLEEVEEERKMGQMGEVWREEEAQMKLADAKFILEGKYGEISGLIAHLRACLRRSNLNVMSKLSDKELAIAERRNAGQPHYASAEMNSIVNKMTTYNKAKDRFQSNRWISSSVSMAYPALDARANPHVVRAMKGHIYEVAVQNPKARLGGEPSKSQVGESENAAAESTQTEDLASY